MADLKIHSNLKQVIIDESFGFLIFGAVTYFAINPYVFGYNIMLYALALLSVVGLMLLYRFWCRSTVRWIITDEQIVFIRGIFTREKDYIELYRVNDFNEVQSLTQRVLGLKSIYICSSDKSHPLLRMSGVASNIEVLDIVRKRVELNKKEKKIYEMANY